MKDKHLALDELSAILEKANAVEKPLAELDEKMSWVLLRYIGIDEDMVARIMNTSAIVLNAKERIGNIKLGYEDELRKAVRND